MIASKTKLNMIIGYPLDHSLTPLLHNSVYKSLNINAVMLAHATENLEATMNALQILSVECIAVTMPYKQQVLSYLDSMSAEVKKLETANTIVCNDGKLTGYNTDIAGIDFALRNITISHKNVLLIGAGGAAHAVAYYLQQNNANLFYLNRSAIKTLSLIAKFGGQAITGQDLNNLNIDIIINATPLGMYPHVDLTPLPTYQFTSKQIVFDMVYNPKDTVLLKTAKTQGADCRSGLDMFIAQGLKQIELYTNINIDFEKTFQRISHELHRC